jgi:hypothetical protein
VPDGPLTLECWFNAEEYGDRTGLVTKTEGSEFGIFVNKGIPEFCIFLDDSYAVAKTDEPVLETKKWHHVAGVYDGEEVRLYLDGEQVARVKRSGVRRTNSLPLLIAADVDGKGQAVSPFTGMIDEVRLSSTARYHGESFTPERRIASDDHTLLLLQMDGMAGPWVYDSSPSAAHARFRGDPKFVDEDFMDE